VILRLHQACKHLSCCEYLPAEIPTKHNRYFVLYSVLHSLFCVHYVSSSWFQHKERIGDKCEDLTSRGITRLDGAWGKKQVWCPSGKTWYNLKIDTFDFSIFWTCSLKTATRNCKCLKVLTSVHSDNFQSNISEQQLTFRWTWSMIAKLSTCESFLGS